MELSKSRYTFVESLLNIKFIMMNTGIRIQKFELTESEPVLKLTEEQQIEFVLKKILQIELIEIENLKNINDLILVLTNSAIETTVTPVYFYKHRTKFLHQDGKFILDTRSMKEFLIPIGGRKLEIKIIPEDETDKFKITMYYRAYSTPEEIK